jgi:hypothetical protein
MNQTKDLVLHPEAARAFNELSKTLTAEVLPPQPNGEQAERFRPEVFVSAHFSEEDIAGGITQSICDQDGNEVGRLLAQGGQRVGLVGERFHKLKGLATRIYESPTFRDTVSRSRVLDVAFDWVIKKSQQGGTASLCDFVVGECAKQLRDLDIWVPLYKVHAEEDIRVGFCLFRTVTAAMLDEWERHVRSTVKEPVPRIEERFRVERKRMQGSLAATTQVYAEPKRGYELAQERAEYATGLLNFFHPASASLSTRSYATLLGQENEQTRTELLLDDGRIRGRLSGILERNTSSAWLLGRVGIARLRESGLDKVGALWEKEKKSDFDVSLLNALLLYSRSSLRTLVTDRLVYICAALESMLLRNRTEPVVKNIGERMAFLVKNTIDERKRTVRMVEEVYDLRSSFVHHGENIAQSEIVEEFMRCAWASLRVLLLDSEKYQSRTAMFDAIDNLKFG